MKLDIYLNYPGHCEEAFHFYAEHLGGRITGIQRHGVDSDGHDLPAEWVGKVLHARLELGGTVVMGADVPQSQPVRSAYLTLSLDSAEQAERVYALLGQGGEIFMEMRETFFASRFAMLRDRFGTTWMLLHEHERPVP